MLSEMYASIPDERRWSGIWYFSPICISLTYLVLERNESLKIPLTDLAVFECSKRNFKRNRYFMFMEVKSGVVDN